ncbi:hypothetical protein F0562_018936 [Nyssa sinensis]|uniref:Uncharacterized protein n=1 Tax=Nyssa sinensis TaxID=561372 RepID=A0A5J4Z9M3_9ASTE|nr:hypothetical protein F0562_018936 [Nyssa sinensis]
MELRRTPCGSHHKAISQSIQSLIEFLNVRRDVKWNRDIPSWPCLQNAREGTVGAPGNTPRLPWRPVNCFFLVGTILHDCLTWGVNTFETVFGGKVTSAHGESVDSVRALADCAGEKPTTGCGVRGEGREYEVAVLAISAVSGKVACCVGTGHLDSAEPETKAWEDTRKKDK